MSTQRQRDADAADHALFQALGLVQQFRLEHARAVGPIGCKCINDLEDLIGHVRRRHIRPLMDPEQRAATSGGSVADEDVPSPDPTGEKEIPK